MSSCSGAKKPKGALCAVRVRTFVFRFSVCPLDRSFSSAALALASSSAVRGCKGGRVSGCSEGKREALLTADTQPAANQAASWPCCCFSGATSADAGAPARKAPVPH